MFLILLAFNLYYFRLLKSTRKRSSFGNYNWKILASKILFILQLCQKKLNCQSLYQQILTLFDLKLICILSHIKTRLSLANSSLTWFIVKFQAYICQAAWEPSIMSLSLTTMIKPLKLFYFQAKIKYYKFLIYFGNAINLEKLVFNVFTRIEEESMTFMLLKTIGWSMALHERLLYQEIFRWIEQHNI